MRNTKPKDVGRVMHIIVVACPHPLCCCIYTALVSLLFGTVIPTSSNILMEMHIIEQDREWNSTMITCIINYPNIDVGVLVKLTARVNKERECRTAYSCIQSTVCKVTWLPVCFTWVLLQPMMSSQSVRAHIEAWVKLLQSESDNFESFITIFNWVFQDTSSMTALI